MPTRVWTDGLITAVSQGISGVGVINESRKRSSQTVGTSSAGNLTISSKLGATVMPGHVGTSGTLKESVCVCVCVCACVRVCGYVPERERERDRHR